MFEHLSNGINSKFDVDYAVKNIYSYYLTLIAFLGKRHNVQMHTAPFSLTQLSTAQHQEQKRNKMARVRVLNAEVSLERFLAFASHPYPSPLPVLKWQSSVTFAVILTSQRR